jgi:hypothetical protein
LSKGKERKGKERKRGVEWEGGKEREEEEGRVMEPPRIGRSLKV